MTGDVSSAKGLAVVIGASGGLGAAISDKLRDDARFSDVVCFSRASRPRLDLTDESTISAAAADVAGRTGEVRLIIDATGFLHGDGIVPEKAMREIDPAHLHKAFAINAIGPALLMKHFLPLLPRAGRAVFVTLSARVGSIGDNELGGWYSYRASKAALNQLVRTAAIELKRRRPEAVCVALHPGTVDTSLSAPFAKANLDVRTPLQAADAILQAIDTLTAGDSGGFFDYKAERIVW